ncbi:cytochrome P450 monooxygenase [Immersiella caudata]|uniref:Cytochrome P450 monooxygenase n=1 Tax=Immersiella caudata TaxID=314043 RepID=A0AA39WL82_9PEZI|nr:cytochrome P450 monooxygenase [Immersiella caudata]
MGTKHIMDGITRLGKDTIAQVGMRDLAWKLAYIFILWQICGYIYNLHFHPCARYPGPLLCRMSKLPNLYYAWRGTKHLRVQEMHKKYGDVVRLEPAFLSLITPNAVQEIYGAGSKFRKGLWYARAPMEKQALVNIASATDLTVHSRKKRLMSHAFSDAALRSYENTVLAKIQLLCRQLPDPAAFGGEYKNMARWLAYLTYDIMGKLTFSHEYNMLTSDDGHFIQPVIDTFQHGQIILGAVPWVEQWGLAPLLFVNVMSAIGRFQAYVDRQVSQRIADEEAGRGHDDIFRLLLNHEDKTTGEKMGFKELSDEAVVLIIAASDTTATALTAAAYYLARYPDCYARLQREVRTTFPDGVETIVSGPLLSSCRYLWAAVEEALRMCPGVPGFLVRESPVDAVVDGHLVPAGTHVGVPGWAMHRRSDLYPDPQVYRPERWLQGSESDDELRRLRSAHFPFSRGPRACIGKKLAYNTLYLTLARLAFLFDMEVREPLPLEFHVKDHFAAGEKDGPYVKFVPAARGTDGK